MWYVYILVCSDKKHMKIGVSGKNLKRIITHHKRYNILIDSSRFILLTDRRLALKVEKYLLDQVPSNVDIRTGDGSTEIRELKWAKNIKSYLQQIKKDPYFSYNEVRRMNFNLSKVGDLVNKLNENIIDNSDISKQLEILKVESAGSVRKKKWKNVEKSGINWSSSTWVECLD